MRLGEALATCPGLVLVEQDPAAAEQAGEEVLRALEDSGVAVDSAEPGGGYFETRGVERLYGAAPPALQRSPAAGAATWGRPVRAGQGGGAVGALLETLLARPERAGRFVRKAALSARLVSGGSWRRTATLRDPTAEPDRLKAALAPKLTELPAPVVELRLELVELTEHDGHQLELLPAAGAEPDVRLREGLRQVRASTGTGSVHQVVEVAPWSRIPEARALFVPRDD